MAGGLQAGWTHRGAMARMLWPVSRIYRALWALRQAAYRAGLLKTVRLPVPLVVVGNVVAGGAGKTPAVIAVVRHLQARGLVVGVVSRGYGRAAPAGDDERGLAVSNDADPRSVGDEPLLIRRRTGAPVFVGGQRTRVAQRLLERHPEVQVLVCDDGLQHTALARDIEICVFDDRGAGNGWLLPAGPLREPWPRAVDMVLHTGQAPTFGGYRGERRLAEHAVGADGRRVALAGLAERQISVAAVAGIARPQAFFDMLRARGLVLTHTDALPDHADYSVRRPTLPTDLPLLCTEKDAAKLWQVRPDALAVPLDFTLPADFTDYLDRLVDARLSSASRALAS